jgi:hypothetical protein
MGLRQLQTSPERVGTDHVIMNLRGIINGQAPSVGARPPPLLTEATAAHLPMIIQVRLSFKGRE